MAADDTTRLKLTTAQLRALEAAQRLKGLKPHGAVVVTARGAAEADRIYKAKP